MSLDPAGRTVERDSTPIGLTPREFGLLEFLMRNKDIVVTKTEILRNVWDAHYEGPDNVVEVYVGYLRRKIDVPFGINTIETIRGVGYRLQGPVIFTAGSLSLDPAQQTVERDSTPIGLTPREYGLLEFLMRNKDVVVQRPRSCRTSGMPATKVLTTSSRCTSVIYVARSTFPGTDY